VTFPEHDWRLLRVVHRTALDRYCTRVLEECVATIRGTDISPHDRYLRLFRLLKERDESIATAFDDLRWCVPFSVEVKETCRQWLLASTRIKPRTLDVTAGGAV